MAWYNEKSVFNWGRYKGKKVSEVSDADYIQWLHEDQNYNIYFTDEVLKRLNLKNLKQPKSKQR